MRGWWWGAVGDCCGEPVVGDGSGICESEIL